MEIQLKAKVDRTQRCTSTPGLSKIGGVLEGNRFGDTMMGREADWQQ